MSEQGLLQPIGRVIERARVASGQSQYALAERLRDVSGNPSVAREYVARWESGRRIPTPYWRAFLSSVLGVPRVELDRAAAASMRLRDATDDTDPVTPDPSSALARMRDRTVAIVSVLAADDEGLPYTQPPHALEAVESFLASDRRVFVLAGPPGVGKSRLVRRIAASTELAAVQLHDVATWSDDQDLAEAVLGYVSQEPGTNPRLTLEQLITGSTTPWLVIIDGIATGPHLNSVAQQVDALLRQVTELSLRFMLVARTPPEVDLSKYPVLAASTFTVADVSRASIGRPSFRLEQWSLAQARRSWNSTRGRGRPEFDRLPSGIRRLVCLPLYHRMALSTTADLAVAASGSYAFVDECVRSVIRLTGRDIDRVIEEMAALASVEAPELPGRYRPPLRSDPTRVTALSWLASVQETGSALFEHDVVREYFLAVRVSDTLAEFTAPSTTADALDELAEAAQRSATMRGVLQFATQRLGSLAPETLSQALAGSLIDPIVTAPALVRAGEHTVDWLSADVLRSLMFRSISERSLSLAAELMESRLLHGSAVEGVADWVVDAVRTFGADVWPAGATFLGAADSRVVRRLLDCLDLARDDDAAFLAAHLVFFGAAGLDRLPVLLAHDDWRVRAALAPGIGANTGVGDKLASRLVGDRDYKVRAAAAVVLPASAAGEDGRHLPALISDPNWHVRERCLQGLAAAGRQHLVRTAVELIQNDATWRSCPTGVATQLARLRLLVEPETLADDLSEAAHDRALFTLLREIRTRSITVATEAEAELRARGRRSSQHHLVREAVGEHSPMSQADYRGLRGTRAVQVALDVHDLDHALRVARAAAAEGVDFLEVGDPLIKSVGLAAVRAVKDACPGVRVVAEMMSADWGRDQVAMAAEAGADAVLLIGPATTASVRAASQAGLRLGVPVALDVSTARADAAWVRKMESAGVDALAITTNIDLGVGGRTPLDAAQSLRRWTGLPVLVSGGFSAIDRLALQSPEWDVLVIGRSVTDALDPAAALREIRSTIGRPQPVSRVGEA